MTPSSVIRRRGVRRAVAGEAPEAALETPQRRLLLGLLGAALGLGLGALRPPRDGDYLLVALGLAALLAVAGAWAGGRAAGARLERWLLPDPGPAASLPGSGALPPQAQAMLARAMLPGWQGWMRRARLGGQARAAAAALLAALEAAPATPPEALALPAILAGLRQGDPAAAEAAAALAALAAASEAMASGHRATLAAALRRLPGGAETGA